MILVTGGAGYVGSHYMLYEQARGKELIALDNLSLGHPEAVLDTPMIVGDVHHRPTLDRLFSEYPIDSVVHFAASAYVGESVGDPGKYYRNNVQTTLCLLEAMRDHGVRNLVFSSTCATYGIPERLPIEESQAQNPINPYGETKVICERMAEAFDRAHGLRFAAMRYFNAAGADPEGRIGESHYPETHLLPLALRAASGKSEPLTVYGWDYDTPDGTCVRDYIHVLDLARAHSLALERLQSRGESRSYNLGTGTGYSVAEVLALCEKVTGKPVPTVAGPRRKGDPPRLFADFTRARQELGWGLRYTSLEETIETAWRWEKHPRFGIRDDQRGSCMRQLTSQHRECRSSARTDNPALV